MKSRPTELITDPRFEDIATGKEPQKLKLLGDLIFYSSVLDETFIVHDGYVFSESIPFIFWSIQRPMAVTRRGAAAHDHAYEFGGLFRLSDNILVPVTRSQADAVYRELVLAKGASKPLSLTRWATLRVAGWWAWAKNRKHHPLPTDA